MQLIDDTKVFVGKLRKQDFAFYTAAAYLMFEYLRPHVIYSAIDVLPWARLTILIGLFYVLVSGRIKIQGMHVVLFLFMVTAIISSYLSYDTTASFNRLYYIYSWFLIVVFFTACVKNVEQYKLLAILFFLFLFKISLFGARTWTMRGFAFTDWGIQGPSGYFQNSGELSLLMAIFAIMTFAFIYGHKNIHKIYYLVPITAAMTVLGASSRGGQLALAVGVILMVVALGKLRIKNLVFFALIGIAGLSLLPEEQKERFSNMGDDGTSESRLMYWEKGIEMMNDNKLIGVGYYAFSSYFEDNYAPFVQFENFTYRREVAHNSYIQVGSEMGYTGLFLYLLLIWICYRLPRKTRKLLEGKELDDRLSWVPLYCKGMNIALVVYLVGSTFMSVAFYPYLYLFLMLNQVLYNTVKADSGLLAPASPERSHSHVSLGNHPSAQRSQLH
ncbi:O-antigen ligase [Marinimicrobium sp. ABcell2]|uniref:O-antigen ligase family protein n=1 Tax=Marinimicrobium sp. ABcell2 TaxID=3069751 RepID=UPI0027B49C05|nr:O-antigen ligase family protein [Marinimicrobium sp. ABcell2]MDQ2076167.1 O-antigen ligase family protein [Marinimicrobium sp. ABcell2]